MSSGSAPTESGSPATSRRSFSASPASNRSHSSSEPWSPPHREPPLQLLLNRQIVPEHRPHLEFERIVALLATARLRSEGVERAALVEVDQRQRAPPRVAESDQRTQQLRSETRLLQGRIDRVQVVDQAR